VHKSSFYLNGKQIFIAENYRRFQVHISVSSVAVYITTVKCT